MKRDELKASGPLCALCLLLFCIAGCSDRAVIVKADPLETKPGMSLIDPDEPDSPVVVKKLSDGKAHYTSAKPTTIKQEEICRIPYQLPQFQRQRYMVVAATINDGQAFPIVLDTGHQGLCLLSHTHVRDNKLPILPGIKQTTIGAHGGLCLIQQMVIGDVTIFNLLSAYVEQHIEYRWLGLTTSRLDFAFIGLPLMRNFSYWAFDSQAKIVEFSLHELFTPEDPEQWERYTFRLEEGGTGLVLITRLPIAGELIEVTLDTGSDDGLVLAESQWQTLSRRISNVSIEAGRTFYPFVGDFKCQKAIVEELRIGERMIQDAEIYILPDGNPLTSEAQLGTQYFLNTTLVLDFNRSVMWIKMP